MSNNDHNVLKLIWKNPLTRRNYTIGRLTRGTKYEFEYCDEYDAAMKSGWELLEAFPEIKKYESDTLFAAFACRLPDRKRRDIQGILHKYGLKSFDGFELLKKSTGRLPIDTYEFIDPIFPEDENIEKEFFLMGVRYYGNCGGDDCKKIINSIKKGDELKLEEEPDNIADIYAIKVLSNNDELVGYIPRYYSREITERLKKGKTYSCTIVEINMDKNCENCIKVRLQIPRKER